MKLIKRRIFTLASVAAGLAVMPYMSSPVTARKLLTAALTRYASPNEQIAAPSVEYGFVLDSFQVVNDIFRQHQSMADVLKDQNVAKETIATLTKKAKAIFNLKEIKTGKEYLLLKNNVTGEVERIIYQPDPYRYIVFDLRGEMVVKEHKYPVEIKTEARAIVVEDNWWATLEDADLPNDLIAKMQDALKKAFDFRHIGRGDRFKLVYERKYVEGRPVAYGALKAVFFEKDGEEFYAFKYQDKDFKGYFDHDGRPYKLGFLLSPIKSARISSFFDPHRFHPILQYVRPHNGTDYAAPYGTPIVSVADGIVTAAAYGGGNGNFVKVNHNNIYDTQYLHMSSFAKGIKPGVRVEQGQVIGYVGATGLATGPHCCFRFWKKGVQVNHLKEKLPQAEPVKGQTLEEFTLYRDSLVKAMDAQPFLLKADMEAKTTKKELHP